MRGTVREWHAQQGWGVVDTAATPGGCWVHFSAVEVTGYRALQPGTTVDVEAERVGQDGYAFRALSVRPVP